MSSEVPDLAALRRAATLYDGPTFDQSWLRLVENTKPGMDLSRAEHRALLLPWLNSWGCRIRYPREGEPAPFDTGMSDWWSTWHAALPAVSLAQLSDDDIDLLAEAYAVLEAVKVSGGAVRRALRPTAAAKALFALRPNTVMPWDAAIATRLHGKRDSAAYGQHQRLGRTWATAIIAEAGGDEAAVPAMVGRPGMSLAKILDEYLYVTITRDE